MNYAAGFAVELMHRLPHKERLIYTIMLSVQDNEIAIQSYTVSCKITKYQSVSGMGQNIIFGTGTSMEYSISPESTGKYIVVAIKGNLRRQDSMQIISAAFDTGAELGIQKYLMDVTEAVHSWPLGTDYMFVNQDLQNQNKFDRSARTAVLVSPEDTSHDFIITVAMNAGLNVRLFRDREQALAFLAGK